MRRRHGQAPALMAGGFTLLEVLVAAALLTLAGALAYGGLSQILSTRERVAAELAELRDLQRAVMRLEHDFRALAPRSVRDDLGGREPALVVSHYRHSAADLTRAGRPNVLGLPRSGLTRVGYRLVEGELRRRRQRVLDRGLASEPDEAVLLAGVRGFDVELLDTDGRWLLTWPMPGFGADQLPVAVRMTLDLGARGRLQRLWVLGP